MTAHTTNITVTAPHRLGAWASRVFWKIAENSHGARAARRAEHLLRLSDEELAARGLRRETIFYEAFGPRAGL